MADFRCNKHSLLRMSKIEKVIMQFLRQLTLHIVREMDDKYLAFYPQLHQEKYCQILASRSVISISTKFKNFQHCSIQRKPPPEYSTSWAGGKDETQSDA